MRTVLIAIAVVAAIWIVAIVALVVIGRRVAARALVTLVPSLARLFRGLLRDPRVPTRAKLALVLAIGWLVSPIDLIPEFVPVLGPLDDAVVGALVVRYVVRRAGSDVVAEHWSGDETTLRILLRVAGVRRPPEGGSVRL